MSDTTASPTEDPTSLPSATPTESCLTEYDYNMAVSWEKYAFGVTTYISTQFCTILLHVYMLAMLADRVLAVKDRKTKQVFFAAVIANVCNAIHVILGNTVKLYFTVPGSILYYAVRALIFTSQAQLAVYLNFCRIEQALRRTARPRLVQIFTCAVFLQFPITLANEIIPGAKYFNSLVDENAVYNMTMVNVEWVYGFLLDVAIGAYTAKALYETAAHSNAKDHLHFIIGHMLRMALFLLYDVLAATANNYPGNDDLSLMATVLWALKALYLKPYLLITDMARVRAIGEAMSDPGQNDNTYAGSTSTKNTSQRKSKNGAQKNMEAAGDAEIERSSWANPADEDIHI
ncbi:uncharacterized protein EV422DRAFT_199446 [Fimicolochytrium jonesii]|uniref:uncharacterized protein n=1 Tax=Fimicolochytrium jonesii TaxID=1396493 RepID=UPI0022FE953A|nr:uncharacterized protein EV422DRAFT_199446 [Fimicolochytrium jonesii]KAI8817946.1 hypothetical protein EV422DRAFT_199446 [Fimicolochytrium jonesii]